MTENYMNGATVNDCSGMTGLGFQLGREVAENLNFKYPEEFLDHNGNLDYEKAKGDPDTIFETFMNLAQEELDQTHAGTLDKVKREGWYDCFYEGFDDAAFIGYVDMIRPELPAGTDLDDLGWYQPGGRERLYWRLLLRYEGKRSNPRGSKLKRKLMPKNARTLKRRLVKP